MDIIKIQILADNDQQYLELAHKLRGFDYLKLVPKIDPQVSLLTGMENDKADIILVFSDYRGDGFKASEELTNQFPGKAVIILANKVTEDLKQIVASGASEIISPDLSAFEQNEIIYRVHNQHVQKQERLLAGRQQRSNLEGKILTVFSTKGGTGKTFISTNLSVALSQKTGKRVVLVDLDLDYGGASIALNLPARYSITNVINQIKNIDPDLMDIYLLTHESGLKVLAANPEPGYNDYINADHINIILNVLRSSYDYIVVDMPGHFSDTVAPAFALADYVLLITTPEILTLKNIKSSLLLFKELNYSKNKIRIILNKASKFGINKKDVESTLGFDVFASIPEDVRGVRNSQNEGKAYVAFKPRAATTRGFVTLLSAISKEFDKE